MPRLASWVGPERSGPRDWWAPDAARDREVHPFGRPVGGPMHRKESLWVDETHS
jgi:hypothetical protein